MCDSLVARGEWTRDGATLFAKNSDRRGREPQPFVQRTAAFYPRGSRLRCTHIEIDQVGETYRVMGHSPDWCWGFEQGVNEFGVAIGNQAVWTREPCEREPGLIGMDLVRLGLERGRNAREALEVIASLVEAYGQGGSAFAATGDGGYQNSFLIADGESAWVLETAARSWAARETTRAALTNELSLGTDWQIGTRQLERGAVQGGFWNGQSRLDFRSAYHRADFPECQTHQRKVAAQRCLAQPELGLNDFVACLRDHGDLDAPPRPELSIEDGTGFSLCMHADPISETTASLVAALPVEVDARPWPVFVSFAAPCTGLFMPVYLDGVLPPAMASGVLWEVIRSLQDRAARDWSGALPKIREAWRALEHTIEADRVRTEEEAADQYERNDREAGADRLSELMERTTDRVLTQAKVIADAI